MTAYDKLRQADHLLKELRDDLLEAMKDTDTKQAEDLHARVSKAIKALSGQG